MPNLLLGWLTPNGFIYKYIQNFAVIQPSDITN